MDENVGDLQGRFQVQWSLAGMPAIVSLEAETVRHYGAFERADLPEVGRLLVYNGGRKDSAVPLPVQVLWPESLQWLFPGGGDGALDARFHEAQMYRVLARSAEDLQGALQEVQNLAVRYVTQGTTWRGFVDFFPDLITRGEPHALAAAAKLHAPQAVSLSVAWQVPAWDAWMKIPLKIRRAWGPIGLFWALLLEQLESGGRSLECEDCHRIISGKKGKRFCGPGDDLACYARRLARNKRKERGG
jgi:hypothetical protein